ncbi:MAG: hypothetical protein M1834_008130 [Cirrosporium novae-zelandiae]|nr:MAG: hypothetical protein M1834_008130 [Cirrosporium novae-zelandiae]
MQDPNETKSLTSFKFLAFDIYGTLIDWESGIVSHLSPLVSQLPEDDPLKKDRVTLSKKFNVIEGSIQAEHPQLEYSKVLALVYSGLAKELGVQADSKEAEEFGESVGTWAAYPDTVEAMKILGKYYKMAPLSNVDRASFGRTLAGPLNGVEFSAIYTAQDIGSYKPSLKNFHYLIEHVKDEFGIEKNEILLTAHSLFHDHVPAKKMGLHSAWISREGADSGMMGSMEELVGSQQVGFGWTFKTLGDMAREVERAFKEEKEGR